MNKRFYIALSITIFIIVIIAISVGVSVKNPADDGQGKSFIILYLNHLYSKIYYSKMKK